MEEAEILKKAEREIWREGGGQEGEVALHPGLESWMTYLKTVVKTLFLQLLYCNSYECTIWSAGTHLIYLLFQTCPTAISGTSRGCIGGFASLQSQVWGRRPQVWSGQGGSEVVKHSIADIIPYTQSLENSYQHKLSPLGPTTSGQVGNRFRFVNKSGS